MPLELTALEVAAVLATYIFAATAKGITGLGFSTTCLPILALIVGLKDALPLVIIPSVWSNLLVMRQAGRFGETLQRFWPMFLALFPGLAFGLWTLSRIDGVDAGAVLGIILLVWTAFAYLNPDLRLPARWERPLAPISGCITGVVNGITGSQVMPAVPFLMSLHLERNLFLQAINCSFTLSSLVMALGLSRLGLFSVHDLVISAIGAVFVVLGLRLGTAIRDRLSERFFRNAVLAMLSLMGATLLAPVFA
ncbi:MAG: sulfite exporter TauE/SafE family protein [Pseudomonadota bacterium]